MESDVVEIKTEVAIWTGDPSDDIIKVFRGSSDETGRNHLLHAEISSQTRLTKIRS
jgi:hypothetical protein